MLAAAILAAGESRRMGTPKALLPFRGTTFAEHLYRVMEHPRVGIRRIVLGAGSQQIQAQLQIEPAAILHNPDWPLGQLSSIQAVIRSLPAGETEGLMLCPVDHPLVSPELVAQLIREFDSSGKSIILPVHEGRRGHPVIFRATLYRELLDAPPGIGARHVVWNHSGEIDEVKTAEQGVGLNLNEPAALDAVRRLEQ